MVKIGYYGANRLHGQRVSVYMLFVAMGYSQDVDIDRYNPEGVITSVSFKVWVLTTETAVLTGKVIAGMIEFSWNKVH